MEHIEGWIASFSSPEHEKGNKTDYAAHGSQYVLFLFQWMRTDEEGLGPDIKKPANKIGTLMCVAVNEVADEKELPAPSPGLPGGCRRR